MQIPSTNFNAWNKVKGGDLALKTWSDPEDVIVLISADVEANVDVDVLASAFNMSKTDFLGRVIVVDDFSQYNEDGTLAVDGSAIQAMICDKAWFKIKTQDFAMDEFYNANNRTWQYYLNDVRMVNYSLFANAVIFATAQPEVDATDLTLEKDAVSLAFTEHTYVNFQLTPPNATNIVNAIPSSQEVETRVEGNKIYIGAINEIRDPVTVTVEVDGTAIEKTITVSARA